MTPDRPQIEKPPSKTRSRVSNGSSTFLDGADGRSALARRYKDLLGEMIRDMGGDPTAAQAAIARRAATLCVWCERSEAAMAAGDEIDIGTFATTANAMRRLLVDLGLERKAKDISPTLASYLALKAAARPVDSSKPSGAINQPATETLTSGLAKPAESHSTTNHPTERKHHD
jgi:hypothetical protein